VAVASQGLVVVKVGGELLGKPGELAALCADIAALAAEGAPVVVVHGGGPQATALQKRLGLEPRMVAGRRVTDAATLDVMKCVIAGQVNVELCAALCAAGARPVGLHGASGPLVRAHRRPPKVYAGAGPDPIDLGHVGDVEGFDLDLIRLLLKADRIPVVACLGADAAGAVYNINGDIVGNQLAAALGADTLVLVTGAPGVLRDLADPSTRLPRLTMAEAHKAIADGIVAGGMIPKLEESFAVLGHGVGRIAIVGHLRAGDVVSAVREPGTVGTTLEP